MCIDTLIFRIIFLYQIHEISRGTKNWDKIAICRKNFYQKIHVDPFRNSYEHKSIKINRIVLLDQFYQNTYRNKNSIKQNFIK